MDGYRWRLRLVTLGTLLVLLTACARKPSVPPEARSVEPVVAPAADSLETRASQAGITVGSALENLQYAYDGESNAKLRYEAFARAASREGYPKVASLFKAAARSEEIHAANHAAVLREQGAAPRVHMKPLVVGTTAENLAVAMRGETTERDVMYPAFVELARREGKTHDLRTLTYALAAEEEHAELFATANANLPVEKGRKGSYLVCPVCGFTVEQPDFTNCPSCFMPNERFLTIT